MFGSNQSQIEEGATVRERQKVISIPDISRMQVNAKVHESQIDKIKPELRAQIRVDAFADQQLNGEVPEVAPLPDAGQLLQLRHQGLHHPDHDRQPAPGLRPGMTAEVEILVNQLDNVLSVPVQAILEYNGKDHVTKKVGDRFDAAEVDLGVSNEKFVQVTKGLADGDIVVLNPISLMSEEEKREAFGAGVQGRQEGLGRERGRGRARAGVAEPPARAGRRQAAAKGKAKARAVAGGGGGAFLQKFQNLPPRIGHS